MRLHRSGIGPVLTRVVAGALALFAVSAPPAQPQAAPLAATSPARCLSEDPYALDQLKGVIDSSTPPSAPVTINQHTLVQFVRSAAMTDTETLLPRGKTTAGTQNPTEPPPETGGLDSGALRVYNTRTGFEYRVTLSDTLLRTIQQCHAQTGRTEAGGPGDFSRVEGMLRTFLPGVTGAQSRGRGAAPQPQGWSDGLDTRTLRTPTTTWPWRTITQSSSWPDGNNSMCSMTLIGPRHLITAAHCLVNFGTSGWKQRKLTPARDGAGVAPYGFSQMTPSPPPGQDAWYIVPDAWLDPSTPTTNNAQYQWDIGLVLMLDRLGDQTGWMGYGAYNASDLRTRTLVNRGYPKCSTADTLIAEAPVGCQIARLYGDTNPCGIGDFYNLASNGWYRMMSVSCDLSRGHSGSPVYHYRYSPSKGFDVPVVSGVVSWHECFQCTASDDYPNYIRRVTPGVLTWMSWLREVFP